MFWENALTATQQCSIIYIVCRWKDGKANTCHVMWLVKVVPLEDCPTFIISIFTLSIKKESHVLRRGFSNWPILINT